ncbi:MAG TPA: twin-arginine translocation pathway signal protein, partial [Burkholderiaceae bacterium]
MTPTPTLPEQPARRRFIRLLGGGAVLASGATLAGCGKGMPDAAVQPWFDRTDPADLRRHMLAHALLAPNPHNRQPWLADLRRDGEITLVCDAERLLPETDPFGRQILIGCGAFIELALLAAAERGVAVQVQPFPDGEPAADR